MTTRNDPYAFDPELDLEIERTIDAPRELVWEAWTNPRHLERWWAPRPVKTVVHALDVRPGGIFRTTMSLPDGQEMTSEGCIVDCEDQRRIVFTDAMAAGFRPGTEPFMTAIITMEDAGSGTRYHARVLHASKEQRDQHEKMGFFDGWGTALAQLEEVAKQLMGERR